MSEDETGGDSVQVADQVDVRDSDGTDESDVLEATCPHM